MKQENKVLRKNLRILRKRKKLTQEAVAKKLFVCRTAYNHYEQGKIAVPIHRLIALTELYGVDLNTLLTVELEAA